MSRHNVSQGELLVEIERSKQSYCEFEPGFAEPDHAVSNAEDWDAKAHPPPLTLRVNGTAHLPESFVAAQPTVNVRGVIKTRWLFPPFYHLRIESDGSRRIVGGAYLRDGEPCIDGGRITARLGEMFYQMAHKFCLRANWRNYSYREEMEGDCALNLCENGLKYEAHKATSPFAFLWQLMTNTNVARLTKEKRWKRNVDCLTDIEMSNVKPEFAQWGLMEQKPAVPDAPPPKVIHSKKKRKRSKPT